MRTFRLGDRAVLLTLLLFALTASAPISLADEVARPDGNAASPAHPHRVLLAHGQHGADGSRGRRGDSPRAGRDGHRQEVDEVTKQDLEAADGIILGCPTYYANIPGKMKIVIDDWSWKMKVDFTDKLGGAFSTGGGQVGGKEHVVTSLLLFMLSNRMIVAGPLYQNEKTGSVWGEPGSSAMTGPLDPGVSEQELDSARRLGDTHRRPGEENQDALMTVKGIARFWGDCRSCRERPPWRSMARRNVVPT